MTTQQKVTERRIKAVRKLKAELADVLQVAIARGELLGYVDDDYRRRLNQLAIDSEDTE